MAVRLEKEGGRARDCEVGLTKYLQRAFSKLNKEMAGNRLGILIINQHSI